MRVREWALPEELQCCGGELAAAVTGRLVHAMCGECSRYLSTFLAPDMNESPVQRRRRNEKRRERLAARGML